jgi:chromosomal replication initiation ATPase DnaA|tara:strand:+ start:6057 stop:6245 length:189 start_codon:yes stop_codon:yes gene_type:complete
MAETQFGLLKKKIQEEKIQIEENLLEGTAKDYSDYRHLIGIIKGLSIAEREVTDMEKRFMED